VTKCGHVNFLVRMIESRVTAILGFPVFAERARRILQTAGYLRSTGKGETLHALQGLSGTNRQMARGKRA
jgi:hypothetical protein